MKKKKVLLSIGILTVAAFIFGFVSLSTVQVGLVEVRADAGEDAASLEAAFPVFGQGDFAQKSSTAWEVPQVDDESPANAVAFNFTTDGNDKTFSAACYAYRATNGPAQLVCTITAVGGNQSVVRYPVGDAMEIQRNWVDTATVTDFWPKTVTVGSSGGGNDVVTTLWFDTMGHRFFKWYIWDADGVTGAEARFVSVWGSYF